MASQSSKIINKTGVNTCHSTVRNMSPVSGVYSQTPETESNPVNSINTLRRTAYGIQPTPIDKSLPSPFQNRKQSRINSYLWPDHLNLFVCPAHTQSKVD